MAVRVERDGEQIVCHTEFRDRDLIRQVPGTTYDARASAQSGTKVWHVPLSWGSCKALRGVFRDRLEVGPLLAEWAWEEYRDRIEPCLQLRQALDADGDSRLYPFQRAGVAFMKFAKRCLLCDDMGTGKTVQTIMALQAIELEAIEDGPGNSVFPILVVCPNAMKIPWARHFEEWWPGVETVVVSGSAAKRKKAIESGADVVIISWELTWRHSRLSPYGSVRLTDAEKQTKELNRIDWGTVIADEAHKLKNPKSKQTRACWWLRRNARYRFGLTGTPLTNAIDTMWSALHFVDEASFPRRSAFIDRYCLSAFNAFGGLSIIGVRPEMAAEFFAIVDPMMRRMPKEVVLNQLPPKVYDRRYMEMGTKQGRAYDQMLDGMLAQLEDGDTIIAPTVLARLTRLIQFSSAYAEVDGDEVRLTEPSNKLDALMDDLEALGDEPVVVFAQSRQLIELAAKRLDAAGISYRFVIGGQTDFERQQHVDDFQNGHARCILVTIAAGGVGLTLTRARIAIFLQRSWSLVDNSQAEARIHRIGSEHHENVLYIDYVSQGTVEEGQLAVLADKGHKFEEVVRDRDFIQRLMKGGV